MALTPDSSPDEARLAQRQLYRAGQSSPAAKPPQKKSKKNDKPSFLARLWGGSDSSDYAGALRRTLPTPAGLTPSPLQSPQPAAKSAKPGQVKQPSLVQRTWVRNRKYILAVLALLLLGTASYCIFLPDAKNAAKEELKAVWSDPNMDGKEKWEKSREIMSNLTEKQQGEMRKERFAESNKKLREFVKKPQEEQYAEIKKRIQEGEKRRAEWEARRGANGGGGGGRGGAGGGGGGGGGRGGAGAGGGGAGGGGAGGGGAGGGGRGGPGGPGAGGPGGPGGPGGGRGSDAANHTRQKNGLDMSSPEDRANRHVNQGMVNQVRGSMGLPPSSGGRGFGPPGGFGGGPGGFGGGPPGGGPRR